MYDEEDLSLSSDSEPSLFQARSATSGSGLKIERRQYHNLLERKRRNTLKYSFTNLKSAIPTFTQKNSRASRAKILRRAISYIRRSELKKAARDQDIRDLKAENRILTEQIRAMESVNSSTNMEAIYALLQKIDGTEFKEHAEEPSDSDEENLPSDDAAENDPGFSEDDYDSPPKSENRSQGGQTEPQVTWSTGVTESDSDTEDSSESEEVSH